MHLGSSFPGGEFAEATSDHSIETLKTAQKNAKKFNAFICEVNTDRGTQFFSNHPHSMNKFEKYLYDVGINHIPSRRNNPQTNGKLERLWFEYDKHRWRFRSIKEFIKWYNRRMHGSLWMKYGETPSQAV